MLYGSRRFKNGKERGYLEFDTGKKIILKDSEKKEFDWKLKEVEYTGRLKEKYNKT